jgi:hypothetical protein
MTGTGLFTISSIMVLSCEEYRDQQQLLALKRRLTENKMDPEEREEIESLIQYLEIKLKM